MVNVGFRQSDGQTEFVEIAEGISLMEGAVRAGIDGIDADCGGQLSCATCHVRIAEQWFDKFPPVTDDEKELLEFAVDTNEQSRLSCQLICSSTLAGMIVDVPATQR